MYWVTPQPLAALMNRFVFSQEAEYAHPRVESMGRGHMVLCGCSGEVHTGRPLGNKPSKYNGLIFYQEIQDEMPIIDKQMV